MKKSLTIIIPAFNEEANISESIDNVNRAIAGLVDDYEIVVVNDASRDNTIAIAEQRAKNDPHIRCVTNERNRGYGFSYWRGVQLATKDYVTGFPADNDMAWESLRDLVKHTGQADIITSYMINQSDRDWHRRTLSQGFVALMNLAFGMKLRYFNGYFVGPRALLQGLKVRSMGLTILAECKVRLITQGCSYVEIPFEHLRRLHGRSTALSLKSIKAVVSAMGGLYWDIHWGNKRKVVYGNS